MGVVARLAVGAVALCALGGATFWYLTAPVRLDPIRLAGLGTGDAAKGERIFWAGGCASCHARPKAEGDAKLELAGGVELKTAFGTFVAPNISQDPKDGIGGWSEEDFANAVMKGVSPSGEHLYPAFPYTSYARMKVGDVADLYAYVKTLPAVTGKAPDHSLHFPFNMRRGLGLWKLLYLDDDPVVTFPETAQEPVLLGRYLAEGAGHCGECHTPRQFTGGTDDGKWLAGAAAAEGDGIVPNITSGQGGIAAWSEADISNYLETGFTPDFDSVGGTMVEVQKNMARLTPEDRAAIAAYLKAIPAHANGYPPRKAKPGT
ncbi:mono/diheme cytochrome c family protein [Mesorhizobium soli]|jgi:mono/diheme cytochrome c family protein|uniref:cytochrome c n=1 Tax=Pseudaminobacter soli (ex Li et al. 2025) TaxID=1295366 RepID=UPI0024753BEF|nr:cytochrome c [Mesorhizobium soli]MDH6230095.1 mono/diheme cytochrome c family protein [Mesorhizobium soli]